jgi:predicted lysophospholipase L1 biosynthesis ABC-type transport system permease subunit
VVATGIYGITSYAAAQRKKEMGIRMAFGANRSDVFSLVMKETCRLALIGSALGFIAAAIAARVATNISYLLPGLASTQSRNALHPGVFVLSSSFSSSLLPLPLVHRPPGAEHGPSRRPAARVAGQPKEWGDWAAEQGSALNQRVPRTRLCTKKVQSI